MINLVERVLNALRVGGKQKEQNVISFYDNINEPGSRLLGRLTGKSLVEFEYDSRGNWTRKTSLIQSGKDGKPQRYHAEERVITYH